MAAKFLLLVASDDAVVDPKEQGMIVRGSKNVSPTVKASAWSADVHFSVEHIAPQAAKANGWDEALYEDPQTIDRLGNLTLLPSAANAYVGKRPWKQKQMIYRYFSSETPAEAEAVFATFAQAGLNVGSSGDAVLGKSSYMPMCKALGRFDPDWAVDIVERRSARLAELAFDRIVGWLKPGE